MNKLKEKGIDLDEVDILFINQNHLIKTVKSTNNLENSFSLNK